MRSEAGEFGHGAQTAPHGSRAFQGKCQRGGEGAEPGCLDPRELDALRAEPGSPRGGTGRSHVAI